MKKRILKIFLIMLVILTFMLLLLIILGILLFLGKVQDYTYLNIDNSNKEKIINLLQEQEENMFYLKDIDLNVCYKNIKRIEVIYRFPDGEDYTIYCKEDKVSFSLDNANYNLPDYLRKNGHLGFRFK